jgi:hypothetical protein
MHQNVFKILVLLFLWSLEIYSKLIDCSNMDHTYILSLQVAVDVILPQICNHDVNLFIPHLFIRRYNYVIGHCSARLSNIFAIA